MSRQWREAELRRRRNRREKLRKLRKRYKLAKTEAEKAAILEKAFRISPSMRIEDFISAIK
ncbi:MAG: hypothetical protein N2257_04535 [Thermodesulfovibrionales bacterium]|nr:hypothetical protein [Thermodesulfovibrionales bacterium]